MGLLDMLLGAPQSAPQGQDLSAILGVDPKQLQALTAQFSPSEQDKRDALKRSLLTAGLGVLADRSGNPYRAIGSGGLLGVGSYNNELQSLGQQRGQSIAQAMAALKAGKDAQMLQTGMDFLKGGNGVAPAAPQGNPSPMGQTSGMGPAFAAPQAPAPQQSAQPGDVPPWANDRTEMAFALMGNKPVADVINRQQEIRQGPQGTLMRGGNVIGQVVDGGMVINSQFKPLPPEALKSIADFAKSKAGAQAAYDFIDVPAPTAGDPTRTTKMSKLDYANRIQAPNGQDVDNMQTAPLTPQQQQIAAADAAKMGRSPTFVGGGALPLGTSSPLAIEAAKAAVGTQASQNTKIADTFANDYTAALTAEKQAPANIQKYEHLKGLWSQVDTGKLAPTVQSLKAIARYVAPEVADKWTQDTPYAQAAQALSNAMALELRNPAGGAGMPGSLSDSDRQYLQSMISSLQSDPKAIPMILDAKIALEKRNQDLGKIARQYRPSNGGVVDEGLYQKFQDYADTHPLFPKIQQNAPAGSGKVVDFNSLPAGR